MIKNHSEGIFIVISGPSGTGKGTICKELIHRMDNLWLSISMTTRERRVNEINGIDYYFINKDEFKNMIEQKKFLEHAIVHDGQYYGTPKKPVIEQLKKGKDVILEIDVNGLKQVKQHYNNGIYIFVLPPSMEELKNRLITRGTESTEKIENRYASAYEDLNNIMEYDYVVVNDNLDEAIDKIRSIIIANRCLVNRLIE